MRLAQSLQWLLTEGTTQCVSPETASETQEKQFADWSRFWCELVEPEVVVKMYRRKWTTVMRPGFLADPTADVFVVLGKSAKLGVWSLFVEWKDAVRPYPVPLLSKPLNLQNSPHGELATALPCVVPCVLLAVRPVNWGSKQRLRPITVFRVGGIFHSGVLLPTSLWQEARKTEVDAGFGFASPSVHYDVPHQLSLNGFLSYW